MFRPLFLSALLALALPASAQSLPDWAAPSAPAEAPPPTSDAPPRPTAPAAPAVPLDGGLGLLALAGGAYAAHRLRGRRPE